MLSGIEGQQEIIQAILNQTPFCVGKLGANECSALHNILKEPYGKVPFELKTNAGVFPLNSETLFQFKEEYKSSIQEVNLLLKWADKWGESEILNYLNYQGKLSNESKCYEPFFVKDNWTNYLKDKKVLVITSHSHTVESQYPKLSQIWNQTLFKDNFKLTLLKAPFQPQFEQFHNSWLETLNWLKTCVNQANFDVLIVGAGAYGLPLAVEAKKKGKVGIHIGGAIQLLFGIKGKRWDNREDFIKLTNNHWVRPLPEDIPKNKEFIEGGCYW
jgi:hypothetical protein